MGGASRFRHTKGTLSGRDSWYTELSPSATSDANVLAASATHLALVLSTSGGGDVGVLPLSATGKRKDQQLQVVHAHSGKQIFDIQFSSLDDSLFGTCGDEGLVKVWRLQDAADATGTILSGHERRTEVFRFHPTASGLLASGSADKTVRVWDIDAAKAVLSLPHKANIEGLSWNYDGSLLASTGGDKTIRIWDPRSEKVVTSGEAHLGVKAQRCVWLGQKGRIFSCGQNKFREREFAIWDVNDLSKPLKRATIDSSTGVLIPLYDADTGIVFLAGKGDSSVRAYEILDDNTFYKEIQSVSHNDGFKCITLLPKRVMSVMDCEVDRVLGVLNDSVASISYVVPRKTKVDFQADLFPDTPAPTPSINAQQWLAGENAPPQLMSLEPSKFVEKREEKKQEEIRLEAEAKANEWKPKQVTGIVRKSNYRHVEGKEAWKRDHFLNVKADCSTRDATPIAANERFFAVPWSGAGGRLAVIPMSRVGKLPDNGGFGMIETGSAVLDFSFHPHVNDLIVTANENAHAYVWKVDEGLMDLKDDRGRPTNYTGAPAVDLRGHYSKVTFTSFHPTASDVLVTSGADGTIKFWDIRQGAEKISLSGKIEDSVQSIDWSFDGSLMAMSSRDRKIKLIDPRSGAIVQEGSSHAGALGVKLTWMGDTQQIISTGFGSAAERELGIWDVRKLAAPLAPFFLVDQGQALFTPFYDHDHRILFLGAKGDGTISFFEVVDEAPFFHYLNKYPTNVPQMGVVRLPKATYNVRDVEICRMLKLTVDTVIPISFTVPRTKKEFFQDDIFPLSWDEKAVMTSDEWFGGQAKKRRMVSLKPEGMELLSNAPAVERVAKYKFDPNSPKKSESNYLGAFYDKMVAFKSEEGTAMQDEKEKIRIHQLNVKEEEMEWDHDDWDEAF